MRISSRARAITNGSPIPVGMDSKQVLIHVVFPVEYDVGRWTSLKSDPPITEMTTATVNPTHFVQNSDSLHTAIKPIINLAQCFAVFPVNGVNTPDSSHLKFTWRSLKILYSMIVLVLSVIMTGASIHRILSSTFTSPKMTTLVFFGASCVTNVLFLRLAMRWPGIAAKWEKIERELATRHRRTSKYNLVARYKIITVTVMAIALIEHALSLVSGYLSASECAQLQGDPDVLGVYFKTQFPQVFNKTVYSIWKGLMVQGINVLTTFSWNFLDLFLILMSTALTYHFGLLNARLNSIKDKTMPEWWWSEARTDYNRLASLTRQVDSDISGLILLSFGINLYFICMQLMYSFNRVPNVIRTIYFGFSFGAVIARTAAVSLSAASVHDESLLPAPVLYSVSSSSYSTEVVRFLSQVTTDTIGLTGMKFFSITRSLVLTVAGTIITYELVLVQFNAVQQVLEN
ncbi:gustatory receptor for sugar taste 64f-like isoform X3 [Diachasmimorpha longicaudata]|uniref:gustatory receptor for sugar taste 64f-like isoform X3 n=1 Tax=Diachasmimorpha longicaudata TaxID=58733 RepID=UPI0030B8DA17